MSSQCAFDSTIRRSESRARNWSPIARIAALTRATCALSSVSGRVRNCGACGTIAAPTTPGRLTLGRLTMLLLIGVDFLERIPLGRLAYARPRAVQARSRECPLIREPAVTESRQP